MADQVTDGLSTVDCQHAGIVANLMAAGVTAMWRFRAQLIRKRRLTMSRRAFCILLLPLLLLFGRAASAADVIFNGTFEVTGSISVVTPLATGDQVWCHVRFLSQDNSQLYEDVNIQATQGSGNSFTCKLDAPFHWDYGPITTPSKSVSATLLASIVTVNTSTASPSLVSSSLTYLRSSEHFASTTKTVINGTVTFPSIDVHL